MTEQTFQHIPVERLLVNPQQPRQEFGEGALNSLADSLKENGVLQALAVEDAGDGWYIIHDGERRWRAAKIAGLPTVPCLITPGLNGTGNRDRLLRALVANEQRVGLNPIEQANAYQALVDLGYKTYEIARSVNKSENHIVATRKLLQLDKEIQDLIAHRQLPRDQRVVEALLSIPDVEVRVKLALRLARPGVSISVVTAACNRLRKHLEEQAPAQSNEKTPAFVVTKRPSDEKKAVRWPVARAAVQGTCDACDVNPKLPNVPEPAWSLIVAATEDTCHRCGIRPRRPSEVLTVCKACPMVEMLRRLTSAERAS